MSASDDNKFVDHPAPSLGLMSLLIFAGISFFIGILLAFRMLPGKVSPGLNATIVIILTLFIAVIIFAFWLLNTANYTLNEKGIKVKYGPSTKSYRWKDFEAVFWRKGMFALKIGWVNVTPCVRLSDGVMFIKKNKRWPLFLTPNDPKAFIRKIALFAPELTKALII